MASLKVLVLGTQGQLAQSLSCEKTSFPMTFLGRPEIDFEKPELTLQKVERMDFTHLINACAYTAVDKAESEKEKSILVNATTPDLLAKYCADEGKTFIHFSTDYVFNGLGHKPWKESDPVSPVNFYGATKLQGEEAILSHHGKNFIFRTSWVYSQFGHNFLKTMLRFGAERELLRVVADQEGTPTFAADLAKAIVHILSQGLLDQASTSGVYHLTGAGHTTWHQFATWIFSCAKTLHFPLKVQTVEAIPTADFPTPAKRPAYSVLDNTKFQQTFHYSMPDWKSSVPTCLQKYKELL